MSKKTLQAHLDDYFKAAVIIYISLQGTMTIWIPDWWDIWMVQNSLVVKWYRIQTPLKFQAGFEN